jgi:integrase
MGHSNISVTGVYARANPEEAIKEYWKAMGGE